ncbi:MAG TPA: hypothetical protein VE135_11755 [Pyrinomonadaceae bacterium]|nr:hypothetical protein [Pyrinomonadaceae bacterium]
MFPQLAQLTDLSLLLLRLMAAAVFVTSGWSHVKNPKERARSIGTSPAFTRFLGAAEVDGVQTSKVWSRESGVASRESAVSRVELETSSCRRSERMAVL